MPRAIWDLPAEDHLLFTRGASFITMKSSLFLCVLLGVVFSVRTASVPPVEAVTVTNPFTTDIVTGLYNDPTSTQTTDSTTLYSTPITPLTSSYCCITTSSSAIPPQPTTYTTPLTSQMMCPDGWEVFLGRCYYFVYEGKTWPEAQSYCALLDSMLVPVHSSQEYAFLQQLTNNNGGQDAWLGGFYLQDQWLWIDGSWFYNNNWSSESPDSTDPCLLLNSNEAWSNSPCNTSGFASICVKNSNVPRGMVCPEGWMGFKGSCYYYNSEYLSWPEADNYCSGLQASLVSIHSLQEYFFLYEKTTAYGFSPTWLGGFYLEDQWMWLDGSWFYQGFFIQMSTYSINSCLSTSSSDGWTNYDCEQSFPSFCVMNEVV
ncbi:macrophage mannose receptor 1-like [Xiphias gladius]|uniref:macrophage mannose receptor 1-like n=1 Tax=Xiphias gladius TaxID=8245 RepID=UPI001A99B74B|nr:macrophage mannose receptor 1-like [Xiphias gladius]